jgi:AcrR family transcriptional regulator
MPRTADPRLKARLLRACATEFSRRGFDPVRVEEITARAGYSKAAFYLHFATKEAAFRELVAEMLAGLGRLVHTDGAALASGSPVEQAMALWLEKDIATFRYLWSQRRVARLMLEGGRRSSTSSSRAGASGWCASSAGASARASSTTRSTWSWSGR